MTLNLDKSHWKRVAFGDVVRNVNETVRDLKAVGIDRIIAMEHMDPGELKVSRWGSTEDGTTFTRRVMPGQTLFGKRRAYQRKVAYAEFDAICSGDIYTFEADETQLLGALLPFLVQSNGFFEHALGTSAGSLSPRTNWRDLKDFEFDLPPLEEQARIADLLWAIERHRRSLAGLLQAARELVRKLRADLFEGTQSDTRADEMFEITIGRQRSPKHETGDHLVPYLRSANVTPKGIDTADVKSMNFEPKEQQKFALRDGDVLVSEASASAPSVGMPAVWREDVPGTVCFQNTLLRYRAVEGRSLPAFVEQYCHWAFESGRFLATASGTNIRHIGVGGASSMKVPRTSISDQAAFISRTATAATAQQALEQEASTVGALLANLINHLLGGS